jgi:hypothetical protein
MSQGALPAILRQHATAKNLRSHNLLVLVRQSRIFSFMPKTGRFLVEGPWGVVLLRGLTRHSCQPTGQEVAQQCLASDPAFEDRASASISAMRWSGNRSRGG